MSPVQIVTASGHSLTVTLSSLSRRLADRDAFPEIVSALIDHSLAHIVTRDGEKAVVRLTNQPMLALPAPAPPEGDHEYEATVDLHLVLPAHISVRAPSRDAAAELISEVMSAARSRPRDFHVRIHDEDVEALHLGLDMASDGMPLLQQLRGVTLRTMHECIAGGLP